MRVISAAAYGFGRYGAARGGAPNAGVRSMLVPRPAIMIPTPNIIDLCTGVLCPPGQHCVGGACGDACTGVLCPAGMLCRNGLCAGPVVATTQLAPALWLLPQKPMKVAPPTEEGPPGVVAPPSKVQAPPVVVTTSTPTPTPVSPGASSGGGGSPAGGGGSSGGETSQGDDFVQVPATTPAPTPTLEASGSLLPVVAVAAVAAFLLFR